MIGAKLGKWVIDKELGHGGMGRVFLAHEDGGDCKAAVKVLSATLAQDEAFLVRFQREIDIIKKLDHPHIVRFYEAGTHEGHSWYAMEFIDGPSGDDLLEEEDRLPWQLVLDLALQISAALKHAHNHGVIHRDLKPANLLCTVHPGAETMTVKLTDFGIAQVFAGTHLTAPGSIVGTAEFLSPEQAAGKPVSKRSDLYSLGAVLYTLLTGRPPFQGESLLDLLHKHQYAQFERSKKVVPEIPHDLDDVICELLEKDPAKRPSDAGVLLRQLERIKAKYERRSHQTENYTPHQHTMGAAALGDRGKGPATLMSEMVRKELEDQNRGGSFNQFLNRPVVLVSLLVVCVGVIVWAFWPLSAATLFQRGAQLMATDDLDKWYEASVYFDKLDSSYPDHPYKEQVEAFREKLAESRGPRNPSRNGAMTEARWFYEEGLRLRQQGKDEAAQKVWRNMTAAFREVPTEQAWVKLAEQELVKPGDRAPTGEKRWAPVEEALKRAREFRDQGRMKEAEAIWQGLEELYREDPTSKEILAELRKDRGN